MQVAHDLRWRSQVTHITITDEIIQAPISVETTATKPARGSLDPLVVLFDLISGVLVSSLGSGKNLGPLIVLFFQRGTMSINPGGCVFNSIASGLDSVMGNFASNLKNGF